MIPIRDSEIEAAEGLLLPEGHHFADDAKEVIRCWSSKDVAACPGSGKTTVLLAKLKLLADRMPLENGAGICVLSHTNVAVNEIKTKMVDYAGKLMGYPNYVGTIQSFIDQFVTLPYLKRKFGIAVQPVDDRTYAEHLCRVIYSGRCGELRYCVKCNFGNSSGRYADEVEYVSKLYCRADGALCIQGQGVALAGAARPSACQFKIAVQEILTREGLIKYADAFTYAKEAVDDLTSEYTDLFSSRFQYVFIDEYQDCSEEQREALSRLFEPTKCCVIHIGDSDQAIYGSPQDKTKDWQPEGEYLSIASSNRYSQEIADELKFLRTGKKKITSSCGLSGCKPVLIVYDMNCISSVLRQFVLQLEKHGLADKDGVYKAIGHVRKNDAAGIKIGSYWDGFYGAKKPSSIFRYWAAVSKICEKLNEGKAYLAEPLVRKLICRIFHYAGIISAQTGKEYSLLTVKQKLDNDCFDVYRNAMLTIIALPTYDRTSVDGAFRQLIDDLFTGQSRSGQDVIRYLPPHFMEEPVDDSQIRKEEQNVFTDPIRGRRIQFDTVHGVKGETHDATLYLETETSNSSDMARVLPYFGVGRAGTSPLFDYSRKLVYVGMSRPKKLLCVAVQELTYMKSKNAFQDWEIVDLRHR